ncbi:hypothetical protein [Polaromonas sp. CG9_12]|nr:hypothetical protein [Polaromonas sp. CG9_12]
MFSRWVPNAAWPQCPVAKFFYAFGMEKRAGALWPMPQ